MKNQRRIRFVLMSMAMSAFPCSCSKGEFAGGSQTKTVTKAAAPSTAPDDPSTKTTPTPSPAELTLKSLAVTPLTSTILAGATQQFIATGTYSDGSTKDITSSVIWSSSVIKSGDFSTVSTPGLLTATAAGTLTVTAKSGSVTGSAELIVTGPTKVECTEQIQYDPSEILCALNEVNHKTVWDTAGGWSTAVASLKNLSASWISPLAPITSGSGESAIQYCPFVPQSDKLIFVSHFVLPADETITLEAVIDDSGQVRLWQDADPLKQVYISDKSSKVDGSVALSKGFYSVVMDGIDSGQVATGAIATLFNADGSVLKQTQSDKEWCIFRVTADTDVVSFVKSAASCRACFIGAAAD